MVFCLKNRHCSVTSDIYQPVNVVDTARPRTSQCALQRFRLPDTFVRIVTQPIPMNKLIRLIALWSSASKRSLPAYWPRNLSLIVRTSPPLGERSRWLVSTRASHSSFDTSTADPRFDMISTSACPRFTCSTRPRRSWRASLAVAPLPPDGTSYGTTLRAASHHRPVNPSSAEVDFQGTCEACPGFRRGA